MDMQNASNLQILEGVVRTIHDKDNRLLWGRVAYNTKYAGNTIQNGNPTPDAPIPVQTVTGEQTVVVTGKNLFDKSLYQTNYNASYSETQTGLRVTSTANLTSYVQIEIPNSASLLGKTVSLSFSSTGSTSPIKVEVRGYQANQSGSISNQFFTVNSDTTFTFPSSFASGKDRFVLLFYTKNVTGEWTEYNDVQLELGATATSYEFYQSQPYPISLSSLELCKIGDYQDYIYKSGDDWYVHKIIGKGAFNGADNEIWYISGGAMKCNNLTSLGFPEMSTGYDFNHDTTLPLYSNYGITAKAYRIYNGDVTAPGSVALSAYGTGGGNDSFYIYKDSYTETTWKTKLSTAPLVYYYVVKNPTETQITDSTLISQLESIHQFLTRYGYTSTVSGNLPIIVDKTSL